MSEYDQLGPRRDVPTTEKYGPKIVAAVLRRLRDGSDDFISIITEVRSGGSVTDTYTRLFRERIYSYHTESGTFDETPETQLMYNAGLIYGQLLFEAASGGEKLKIDNANKRYKQARGFLISSMTGLAVEGDEMWRRVATREANFVGTDIIGLAVEAMCHELATKDSSQDTKSGSNYLKNGGDAALAAQCGIVDSIIFAQAYDCLANGGQPQANRIPDIYFPLFNPKIHQIICRGIGPGDLDGLGGYPAAADEPGHAMATIGVGAASVTTEAVIVRVAPGEYAAVLMRSGEYPPHRHWPSFSMGDRAIPAWALGLGGGASSFLALNALFRDDTSLAVLGGEMGGGTATGLAVVAIARVLQRKRSTS